MPGLSVPTSVERIGVKEQVQIFIYVRRHRTQLRKWAKGLDMVAHICSPSTLGGRVQEFETSLRDMVRPHF